MTTEQCIEVAEKVWGWQRTPDRTFVETWDEETPLGIKPAFKVYGHDELQKEVNSWEGFGRTVEAMAERLGPKARVKFFKNMQGAMWGFLVGYHEQDLLFKLIHLAALEAKANNQ